MYFRSEKNITERNRVSAVDEMILPQSRDLAGDGIGRGENSDRYPEIDERGDSV